MKSRICASKIIVQVAALVIFTIADQPVTKAREPNPAAAILHRLSNSHQPKRPRGNEAQNEVYVKTQTAATHDHYIQADSYSENIVEVRFAFLSSPSRVYFSRSPGCGSLDPSSDYAQRDSSTGWWWVSTRYNPCEDECSYVTITADPTLGSMQTRTVHLDDRYHTGCGAQEELVVSTFKEDPDDPNREIPTQAWVEVTVIPPEAGSAIPSQGNSQYDPDSGLWLFPFTYYPTCNYSGRVRVRTEHDMMSFDQNTETLLPSTGWLTVCDSFCTEGKNWNYYQVYKMYLYADRKYNFSLYDGDGVGARCDADDGDLKMFDYSGNLLFILDALWQDDSTIGTAQEDWSPPSDGYYYLHVLGFDFWGYPTPMSYCLAYREESVCPCSITVTSPSGSDSWKKGKYYYIEWDTQCNPGNDVEIELYKGLFRVRTIASPAYDDGSYYWQVPTDLIPSDDYSIRISSTLDTSCDDYSDWFSISSILPPNDDCSDAIIVMEGQPYNGTTTGATGTYESSCGSYDTADVWHSYTPASTGLVTISLAGSTFDTTLAVFNECDGTELACDDDLCDNAQSEITMLMTGGATYLIRVAGYDGATGDYILTVTSSPCTLPPEPDSPSPADDANDVPCDTLLSWNASKAYQVSSNKAAMYASKGTVMPKVIYGEDDRLEEYEVQDPDILTVGDSTAALVCPADLTYNSDGTVSLPDETFAQWYTNQDPIDSGNPLCDDEPFLDQPNPAFCSGFLVAPDIIATAGHCLDYNCSPDTCLDANCCAAGMAAVFSFVMLDADTPVVTIPESEIYYCTEVIAHQEGNADMALIRLDRAVTGHTPLQVRHSGIVPDGEPLLVIGHPVGLPRKYAGGGAVRDNSDLSYFQANLDTYGANSGSPVFSTNTLEVEGVLVSGQEDFVESFDVSGLCDRSNVCPNDVGCPDWEQITRATEFSAVIPSFDVYLGTDRDQLHLMYENAVVPWCEPEPQQLQRGTTYYWRVVAKNHCGQTEGPTWSFRTEDIITVDLTLDYRWMYQNLQENADSTLSAGATIIDDPLNNSSYTHEWELIFPSDVSVGPMPIDGCGATDAYCTFAACGCDEPNGISDSGQPIGIKVKVTGNEHGNTGTAEIDFGIALLGDVNNDTVVNAADRAIINTFWRDGTAGSFTLRDCDLNCDGVVNAADRAIANLVWRGYMGQNSVTNPCLFHHPLPRR
ncbi:MAG: trypsin-like peptidase domain-containing protein [Chloroflexota bacterium]|nr:MAG: trypsin-like peptidase domain-containing protein [Chloroflexota bacterium]